MNCNNGARGLGPDEGLRARAGLRQAATPAVPSRRNAVPAQQVGCRRLGSLARVALLIGAASGFAPIAQAVEAVAMGLTDAGPTCTAGRRPPPPWRRLAPGVWIWPPPAEADVSPANGGHVAPVTLLVSRGEAMVIDPGPSLRHGLAVRRAASCLGRVRVRWVVNTHAHADTVLANAAWADEVARGEVQVLANAGTRETMARRCPDCLSDLRARAGEVAMAGTTILLPTHTLEPGRTLRVGALRLQVGPTQRGHSQHDLWLGLAGPRIAWVGGLVYGRRVPELAQGRVEDWLAALDRLAAWEPRQVVGATWSAAPAPGHRPPALVSTRAYLQALHEGVWAAMEAGRGVLDENPVPLPDFAGWAGYAARHGFNVQRAWREREPSWMGQGTDGGGADVTPTNRPAGSAAEAQPPS